MNTVILSVCLSEEEGYSYRSLIHHACCQVNPLFGQHCELGQSIVHNIENRIDAGEGLLPRVIHIYSLAKMTNYLTDYILSRYSNYHLHNEMSFCNSVGNRLSRVISN